MCSARGSAATHRVVTAPASVVQKLETARCPSPGEQRGRPGKAQRAAVQMSTAALDALWDLSDLSYRLKYVLMLLLRVWKDLYMKYLFTKTCRTGNSGVRQRREWRSWASLLLHVLLLLHSWYTLLHPRGFKLCITQPRQTILKNNVKIII